MTTDCRVCGQPISAFMTFGRMPIANAFLTPDQIENEYFFELAPTFCEACGTFQILKQPEPELMFHDSYPFFTRGSNRMVSHFRAYADWVRDRYLSDPDPFVVEMGSNDGAMLERFAQAGTRHLGIEPSANVAKVARLHGVNSLVAFFNEETARGVVNEHGAADVLLAANVMCHISDLHSVAKGAATLLKPNGVLVFEDPYLGAMIEKTSYDQIYDEHVFIFSLASVRSLFGAHGFEVIDVVPQTVHGGSMRYVLARAGARPVGSAVGKLAASETAAGLDRAKTYDRFRARCEASRDSLVRLVRDRRARGDTVAGYGATSKSTTVLNYCGLGPDDITFISDTTPEKQGKVTPGTHISVVPHAHFSANHPDSAVLFAWNHQAEIFEKEVYGRDKGEWIVFVPEVGVIHP